MTTFIKNILLSNREIDSSDLLYHRLITINISLFLLVLVASIFSVVNFMEDAYRMLYIDLFALVFGFICIYVLRKNYDIEKVASFSIVLLFIIFVSIIIVKQATEYTLLWVTLFPMIAIVLKGTKEGLYYTVVYAVVSWFLVYDFIGETITMNGYIRFLVLSIILIILVYYNQYRMESVLSMLQESKEKVEDLNTSLEQYNEEVTAHSNELKERLELALIGSNDGFWDWNILDQEVYFSPRCKEMIGYKDEELANDHLLWKELIHHDDFESVLLAIKDNLDGKKEYFESTHRLKHKDGHWVWILNRGKTFFDEKGKAIRMSGTHTDISEQKNIERNLAIQYNLLTNIVDTVPVRIFWKDLDGVYMGANKLFLGDAQLNSTDEIIGKNDYEMPWGETEAKLYRDDDEAVIKSDTPKINFEEMQTDDEGNAIFLLTSKVPLKDEEGKIIGILGSYADISEQRRIEEELKIQKDALSYQAYHDYLTGLPNRILFNDRLIQAIEKAKRNETKIAVLFIDLDHFKEINDSLGHETGDEVLKDVTHRLSGVLREEDTLARLGGDEFTVILENLHQAQDASILAKKILEVLVDPILLNNETLYVSSSIGVSIYPDDGMDSTSLLKFADSAMYKAKNEGRNNFQFYNSRMTELALERVLMETNLRAAINNALRRKNRV